MIFLAFPKATLGDIEESISALLDSIAEMEADGAPREVIDDARTMLEACERDKRAALAEMTPRASGGMTPDHIAEIALITASAAQREVFTRR